MAGHLRHVAAAGLVEPVGGSPDALRLVVEFGERGERALAKAGPDAADVVFEDFADATLRNQAVEALAEHGPMALAILDKYAADPDFREILRADGPAVIPPIARADSAPEALALLKSKPRWSWSERLAHSVLALSGDSGQATIRLIKDDGLSRVAELDKSDVEFQQFLPLYDLLHLANVARRGHSPTSGEMAWALIDGCFVVADVLSLAAVQPEGVVAAEAARAEVRSAVKRAVGSTGREAVEAATTDAAKAAGPPRGRRRDRRRGDRLRPAGPLVDRPSRRRDVPGPPPPARGPAEADHLRDRRPRPGALLEGRPDPHHLGAAPVPQGRRGDRPPHPTLEGPEIPRSPGHPGRRGRGRIPQDGGTSILQKAAKYGTVRIYGFPPM